MDQDTILKLQDIYSRTLLIPVVGSGLSVPFGVPDWRKLIEQAAAYFDLESDKQSEVKKELDKRKFLDAVDLILDSGVNEDELQKFVVSTIKNAKEKADKNTESNYLDLSQMTKVRFMTTNYDGYINDITGAKSFLLSELDKIAINEFPLMDYDHTVIPIHGEIADSRSIVLSRSSYEALYESDDFEREFQYLRTHFTFLFVGFSFDDEYFQKMFQKVVKRFETTHYILFEQGVESGDKDKIQKLSDEYGVKAVYYDASAVGHTKAISQLLKQIFRLEDSSIDISGLTKLPDVRSTGMSYDEQIIIDQGRKAIQWESLSELYDLYTKEYESSEFGKRSIDFQIEIISGLIWYYGYKRQDDLADRIVQKALTDSELGLHADKFVFLYGQLLWNLRKYTECIEMLEQYRGDKDVLCILLYDIVVDFKKFLPEQKEVAGILPVYEKEERSQEEKDRFHFEYVRLRDTYVNPDTYNLLDVEKYGDKDAQQIAYYWLGIIAGQLFHEHQDALQYLLRSYELAPRLVVCEELAYNYLAIAENTIRYEVDPKTYQVDMNSLLKAKIRFQYVMNAQDEDARISFYERSGSAYLRTLYLLKDYFDFENFYEKSHAFIPVSEDLYRMKAEVDAAYEHMVKQNILDKLSPEDQKYIMYCCAYYRAQTESAFMQGATVMNPYRAILKKAEEENTPIKDKRILRILLDCCFFGKDTGHYELYKQSCSYDILKEMVEVGFEDELYERYGEAEQKYISAFKEHCDYQTFRVLRGFYMRRGLRKKYDALYQQVLTAPPDDMFLRPHFYMDYIVQEIEYWRDSWSGLRLYAKYRDNIEQDIVLKKEIEETLKIYVADYANYEDRIAWNRYMMTQTPESAQLGMYMSILKLYVANLQYRKADQVVREMRKKGLHPVQRFDELIQVCIEKQGRRHYVPVRPYFSSGNLEQMKRQLIGNVRYFSMYFDAFGMEITVSMKELLCMFYQQREREFEVFSSIHIMYAGVINLQNSLWAAEDPFLRMVLQWIGRADNVKLEAPSFKQVCEYAPNVYKRDHMAEDIQMKLFCEEHPEVIRV